MCSICAGVEKISDYIVDGKLKISQESATAFQTAAEKAITCVSDNITGVKLSTVVEEIVAEYADDTCQDKKSNVATITQNIMAKAAVKA